MLGLLQNAIRAIWEILLLVPMPWRTGVVILVTVLFLYQLVWRLLTWLIERLARFLLFLIEGIASLLLFPEYWITKQLRRCGRQPLVGTYAFGSILQGIVGLIYAWTIKLADIRKQWRLSKRWAILIVAVSIIPILLWYLRPSLEDTTAAHYIDHGVVWWYSIEKWVLTGERASPAQAVPAVKPGTTSPLLSGGTATPKPTATPKAKVTPTPRSTRTPTATPVYTIYVVQPGDSLSEIAKRFGVSVEDLIAANREKYPSLVTDPASIKVGWELLIPEQK